MIGKVKWFDDGKGYGFIEVPGSKDAFVHHSGIAAVIQNAVGRKTLLEGAEVEFDVSQGEKGPKAETSGRLGSTGFQPVPPVPLSETQAPRSPRRLDCGELKTWATKKGSAV